MLEIAENISIFLKHQCLRRVDVAEFMLPISGRAMETEGMSGLRAEIRSMAVIEFAHYDTTKIFGVVSVKDEFPFLSGLGRWMT